MSRSNLWFIAFCQLVAIKEHPRNDRGADLEACAALADLMVELYYSRFKE